MRVLLHTCCGPCASSIVERMLERGHTVTMFFYNPNIFPRDEYMKRERSARKVAEYFGVEFIDPIDPSADGWEKAHRNWLAKVNGLESQPEGRLRCAVCFGERLAVAAAYAAAHGHDAYATSLVMGPMKDIGLINRIGDVWGKRYGVTFISENFRKRGGYPRSIELSKTLSLYRQNYCGCEFSMNKNSQTFKYKKASF